jgi:hypothetical protein
LNQQFAVPLQCKGSLKKVRFDIGIIAYPETGTTALILAIHQGHNEHNQGNEI